MRFYFRSKNARLAAMLRNPNQNTRPRIAPVTPPYYLSRRCALSLRHRELLILRTTARCGAEYEWGVHVQVFSAKAGLTGEQVRSVTAGHPDDPCWTDPADRAVLRAADALDRDRDLSDADWTSLVTGVGEEGAVDALLICGWYRAISYVARATRLAPEPGAPLFAGIDP